MQNKPKEKKKNTNEEKSNEQKEKSPNENAENMGINIYNERDIINYIQSLQLQLNQAQKQIQLLNQALETVNKEKKKKED